MSKFTTSALMLSSLFMLSALAFSSHAQAGMASGLQQCKGGNEGQVTHCCNAVIRKSGERPSWWMTAGGSCSEAVICVGGSYYSTVGAAPAKKKCYVDPAIYFQGGGNDPTHDTGKTGGSAAVGSTIK